MGAGPTFFLSTCRLHHHTQLSPVRLPPHWFSCFFYLVLNLSPPPVSQNAPPTPTSPFILPSPSGPANPCPSGHLTGVQRPVRWPRSSNTLQVCGRGETVAESLEDIQKERHALSPRRSLLHVSLTARRDLSKAVSMPSPFHAAPCVRMAGHRSPGSCPIPREDSFMEFPLLSIDILDTFLLSPAPSPSLSDFSHP